MNSYFRKERQTTLAGILGAALLSVVLLCGAGSVPVENWLPQGTMQGDLNAGGHNITNAATVSASTVNATNVSASGSLTLPSGFTFPFSSLSGKPTSLAGYGITDPLVSTSGSYANPTWLTSLAYSKLSGAPTLGGLASITPGTGVGAAATQTLGVANGLAGTATANIFTQTQSAVNFQSLAGPIANIAYIGDSRWAGGFGVPVSAKNATGYINSIASNLQVSGFGQNAFNANYGESGQGITTQLFNYNGINSTSTTGTVTAANTITGLTSTAGLSGTMNISGPGIPPGFTATVSGTTATLTDGTGLGRTTTASGGTVTVVFSTAVYPYNNNLGFPSLFNQYLNPPHQLSYNITGIPSYIVLEASINDTIGYTYTNCSTTSGSNTITLTTAYYANPGSQAIPYVGETFTSSAYSGAVTITGITQVLASGTNYTTVQMTTDKTANTTSSTVTITTTAVASALVSNMQTLVNAAVADGSKVLLCTIFKAYSGSLAAGDTVRQAVNSSLSSIYGGGAVSGVTLCDIAGLPLFGSNDPNIYRDGVHCTDTGEAALASFINTLRSLPFRRGKQSGERRT